jgi:gluconolactonase
MMRLVEPTGEVSVFREHSNNSNGNAVDNQGRLRAPYAPRDPNRD